MSIIYSLHKNNLPAAPEGSYRAIVHFKGTIDTEKLLDRMMERDPGITREIAQAAVKLYHNTIYAYVLDGYRIVTPFGIVGVSIKGVFERQTDSFDSSRHSVEPTLSSGAELRRIVHEKAQLQQQEANNLLPNPLEYRDLPSGEFDSIISPGRVAEINGYRLKFDEADPTQGIFFIAANGDESRVSLVVKNNPRQLIFEAPAGLTPGNYTVEIRALSGNTFRVGRLPATLIVA